jgi:hypothetical protein
MVQLSTQVQYIVSHIHSVRALNVPILIVQCDTLTSISAEFNAKSKLCSHNHETSPIHLWSRSAK